MKAVHERRAGAIQQQEVQALFGSIFFSDHFGGFVILQAPQGPFYMSHRGSEE